jgi:hypothetical protein
MGNCFGSPPTAAAAAAGGHEKSAKVSKTPKLPFSITVAFPTVQPFTLTVDPSDRVSKVRAACEAEMIRRQKAGADYVRIEGTLMTLNVENGEADTLKDTVTMREACIEDKQYLWFHDKNETSRVDDLILRSSRLHENRSHNSRGVKAGMALIKAEEGPPSE